MTDIIKFILHGLGNTKIVGGLIDSISKLFRNPWIAGKKDAGKKDADE